jgi:uncharacterized protein
MAQTTTTTKSTPKTTTPQGNPNPPVTHAVQHFEIVSTEPVKVKKFLEKQFGWKFESQKIPGSKSEYHSFRTPDGNGGGVIEPQMPTQPLAVTPYINVDDCEASEKSCQKNGATIIMPTTEIPGVGKFFIFTLPNCPPLACFQYTNRPGRN